jgi:hypothetical protein
VGDDILAIVHNQVNGAFEVVGARMEVGRPRWGEGPSGVTVVVQYTLLSPAE